MVNGGSQACGVDIEEEAEEESDACTMLYALFLLSFQALLMASLSLVCVTIFYLRYDPGLPVFYLRYDLLFNGFGEWICVFIALTTALPRSFHV